MCTIRPVTAVKPVIDVTGIAWNLRTVTTGVEVIDCGREAEIREYQSLLGWTEDEAAWLADFMEDSIAMHAACGESFGDAYSVESHELHCGPCQGVKEADLSESMIVVLAAPSGTVETGKALTVEHVYTCDWCDQPATVVIDHGQDFACSYHFGYHFGAAIEAGEQFRVVPAPRR